MVWLLIINACAVLGLMIFGFLIAQAKKDMSVVDIFWGLGFIAVALVSLFYAGTFLPRQLLVTTLVLIWGIRLSGQIGLRKIGHGEDARYQKWRKDWGKNVALYSFLYVFMLQGIILLVIALPIMLINADPYQPALYWMDYAAVALWIVGFLFESIADYQLYTFIHSPHQKNGILTTGLRHYSRHPNYFGEALMWWSIYFIACSVHFGFLGVISPILLTYLLLYVSGIPLIEKQLEHNPQFQAYRKKTSAFIPWFPKD